MFGAVLGSRAVVALLGGPCPRCRVLKSSFTITVSDPTLVKWAGGPGLAFETWVFCARIAHGLGWQHGSGSEALPG
jgi:hypothetical protein